MKNKFKTSLAVSVICGLIGYKIFKAAYALPTSDWAAKGVPIFERFWDTFIHGLPGGLIGMIVGFCIGFLIPQKFFGKEQSKEPEKSLNTDLKIAVYIVSIAFLFIFHHFFQPTILSVAICFIILALVYFGALHFFGVPVSTDNKENF